MKAILVTVSVTTRIVVPDDFNIDDPSEKDYELIREKAYPRLHRNLDENGVGDSLPADGLEEDTEMPFGTSNKDEYYQPSFTDMWKKEIENSLSSFEVFASKKVAQKAFPGVEILTHHGDDIEDITFVDERYE